MKILILTDSLGAPRKELDFKNAWTYKFIEKYSLNNIIFTKLDKGLTSNNLDYEFVGSYSPDIVICQIGIVDATRRPIPWSILRIVKNIPIFSSKIRTYLSKNHYKLTQKYSIHYANVKEFDDNLLKLENIVKKGGGKIIYVPIAPASSEMKRKVFNIENDIVEYNNVLKKHNRIVIDGYKINSDIDSIFLEDGHHLNEKGNELLFTEISSFFDEVIRGQDDE